MSVQNTEAATEVLDLGPPCTHPAPRTPPQILNLASCPWGGPGVGVGPLSRAATLASHRPCLGLSPSQPRPPFLQATFGDPLGGNQPLGPPFQPRAVPMGMLYSPHHSHQAGGGLSPGRVNRYEEILLRERNETRALSHGRDPERMQVEASSPPQRHAEPGRDGGGAAEPREHGSAKLSACRIKPHLSEHLWNFLSNVPMNAAVFSVGCSAIRNVGPSNTQRWPPRSPAEGTPWLPRAPGQNPNPSACPPSGWD